MQMQASRKPNNVLPASPMKQRKRRLNFAGMLKMRKAATAPHSTTLTLADDDVAGQ